MDNIAITNTTIAVRVCVALFTHLSVMLPFEHAVQ